MHPNIIRWVLRAGFIAARPQRFATRSHSPQAKRSRGVKRNVSHHGSRPDIGSETLIMLQAFRATGYPARTTGMEKNCRSGGRAKMILSRE